MCIRKYLFLRLTIWQFLYIFLLESWKIFWPTFILFIRIIQILYGLSCIRSTSLRTASHVTCFANGMWECVFVSAYEYMYIWCTQHFASRPPRFALTNNAISKHQQLNNNNNMQRALSLMCKAIPCTDTPHTHAKSARSKATERSAQFVLGPLTPIE